MSELRIAKAPLYKCPVGDGPSHPRVIWNKSERAWYLFYAQRNAHAPLTGDDMMSFCNGMGIGIASSKDGGKWIYRGSPELSIEPGRNTWWFPEVVLAGDTYHLFCSYVQGFPTDFDEDSHILHYTSTDLWDWKCHGAIKPDTNRQISPTVYRVPDGRWRMNFLEIGEPVMLESPDLFEWKVVGPAAEGVGHDGSNVFQLGGSYWLTHDVHDGFGVFKSGDCITWEKQDYRILSEPGSREDDGGRAHHSGVVALEDKVYVFYFIHPERLETVRSKRTFRVYHEEVNYRRTVIQVAQITEEDGRLVCDRNEPFDFFLPELT